MLRDEPGLEGAVDLLGARLVALLAEGFAEPRAQLVLALDASLLQQLRAERRHHDLAVAGHGEAQRRVAAGELGGLEVRRQRGLQLDHVADLRAAEGRAGAGDRDGIDEVVLHEDHAVGARR